jgi:hypothetical protein
VGVAVDVGVSVAWALAADLAVPVLVGDNVGTSVGATAEVADGVDDGEADLPSGPPQPTSGRLALPTTMAVLAVIASLRSPPLTRKGFSAIRPQRRSASGPIAAWPDGGKAPLN